MSKSLPSKYIVQLGKFVWTTMWRTMMSQLAPSNKSGDYVRPPSQFRNNIARDSDYPPEKGRYQLFVGMGCPWAHRTLVVRTLKGLEATIPVSVVYPSSDEGIWVFETTTEGCKDMRKLYQLAQPGYQGRCTVPVLWDSKTKTIVNNESADIIVILNSQFNEFATYQELDLYPPELQPEIDRWNEKIYHTVNNGVYKVGFAQTQSAYETACQELFTTLDQIDEVLATNRYLCGKKLTLADIRLFTTLFRFDIVYYGLFKCSRQRIQDYTNLGDYLRDIYQLPGVADTCDIESVKRDYYGNLFPLNPGGIIPISPDLTSLTASHQRQNI